MGAEGGQRLEPGGLELRQGGKGVVVLLRLLLAEPPHILRGFVPGGGRVADQFCQSVGQVLLRHGVQGVGHIPGDHQHAALDKVLPAGHRAFAAVLPPVGLARGGPGPGDEQLLHLLRGDLLHGVLVQARRRQNVVYLLQRVQHLLAVLELAAVLVLAEGGLVIAVQEGGGLGEQLIQGVLSRVLISGLVLGLVHGDEDITQVKDIHSDVLGAVVQAAPGEAGALGLAHEAAAAVNAVAAPGLHAQQDVALELMPAQLHVPGLGVDRDPVAIKPRY